MGFQFGRSACRFLAGPRVGEQVSHSVTTVQYYVECLKHVVKGGLP